MNEEAQQPEPKPDFGPRGYVPPQAAKRARKIVLREPMGLGWPIAAVVAGALLALLGALYLLTQTGPPGAPFERVGALEQIDARGAAVIDAESGTVLVVRAGGGVRAYLAPQNPVAYCTASKLLEGADGSVWSLDGRLQGGPGTGLAPLQSRVHEGVLYVNRVDPLPARAVVGRALTPAC